MQQHGAELAPPAIPASYVTVFDEGAHAWTVSEDHRGQIVYDINTGQSVEVMDIGPLPAEVTLKQLPGPY